jgi:regulator of protease activity HflC (stomatin/prohibitin superfamily)
MDSPRSPDRYRGVIVVLLTLSGVATVFAAIAGARLANPILLDAATSLGLGSGLLIGVVFAQIARARPMYRPLERDPKPAEDAPPTRTSDPAGPAPVTRGFAWFRASSFREFNHLDNTRIGTASVGLLAIVSLLLHDFPPAVPPIVESALGAGSCLIGAALAATAVRYLTAMQASELPEAAALTRGARILTWALVLAALGIGLAALEQWTVVLVLHGLLLIVNSALCIELLFQKPQRGLANVFRVDLGVLSILGSRPNAFASVLDAAERQLGIDLRSTWALTVVRRSVEPLVVGLAVVAWLSTSLSVIGVSDVGLVERLGVPAQGPPLAPGLHVHWPWPIDQVFRIPAQRVQVLTVGHEGDEQRGPENVLWAEQHAANEYTLLLGNGRDLITVDAAVQFRITDARAWRYHTQNPADALRAISYRAVMRNTVDRTLADALSENLVATTQRMRDMVQRDADDLALGVEVLGFTVGGMHPPVAVARDYQAVVSAELRKVTAVVDAQAVRNQSIPLAEAAAVSGKNAAQADGASDLGRAVGEASSFLILQSQYNTSPQEYLFRRRLETLERSLAGRRFVVVDSRFQRDGGELWVNP